MQLITIRSMFSNAVLIIFLAFICTPAKAEWKLVVQGDDRTSFYVDPATLNREGRNVRAWSLINYGLLPECAIKNPTPYEARKCFIAQVDNSVWSEKVLMEFDCGKSRSRDLSIARYNEQMGVGDIVSHSDSIDSWSYVIPDSNGAALLEYVCVNWKLKQARMRQLEKKWYEFWK